MLAIRALRFDEALAKAGYRHDQPRHPKGSSEGGRWSGGGSGGAPKVITSSRAARNAIARHRYAQAQRAKAQLNPKMKRMNEVLKRIRDSRGQEHLNRMKDALNDLKDALKRASDGLRSVPDGAWYEPTFADYVHRALTAATFALGLSGLGSLLHPVIGGSVILATGVSSLYMMARYAYRKIATSGAYQGVRGGLKDAFWGPLDHGGIKS